MELDAVAVSREPFGTLRLEPVAGAVVDDRPPGRSRQPDPRGISSQRRWIDATAILFSSPLFRVARRVRRDFR
jgi:hypothetical protein